MKELIRRICGKEGEVKVTEREREREQTGVGRHEAIGRYLNQDTLSMPKWVASCCRVSGGPGTWARLACIHYLQLHENNIKYKATLIRKEETSFHKGRCQGQAGK